MKARIIKAGRARGRALVSAMALSFLGGIDPETGTVIARDSDIAGESIAGRILVFPRGKGSTVGSYILLRLKKNGVAPLAIVNELSEPIVAVGAIIADIPMVDKVDISQIATGDEVSIDGENIEVRTDVKGA
ncbi:DUF126 domain-containing protein [archaeon]|nr:MAG: DUF126 domain-containing protein [archaeon]